MLITGASGVGKTTFINMLYRFYDPKKGSISIDGQNVRDLQFTFRKHISLSAQSHFFFNDSILNNIRISNFNKYFIEKDSKTDIQTVERVGNFVPRQSHPEEEIVKLCDDFGLHSKISDLSDRYDFVIGDNGNKLSGGERQRLNIIRTLLKPASIYVFDEPTNFLDNINRQRYFDKLMELKKAGKTVIVVSHDLDMAELCDKVLCFKEDGTYEYDHYRQLLKNEGKFSELWEASRNHHEFD